MNKLKKDIIFLAGVVLTAFLLWLFLRPSDTGVPAVVRVYQDGRRTAAYSLMEDQSIEITWGEHYNLLLIEDGKASISDADCPDRLCVRQREISRNGESIICLPHRLTLQIESWEERELDALTY